MHFFRQIKTLCISGILVLLFALPVEQALAQGGPGGPRADPGCDPCCPLCPGCPPQCIPIDGGIGLLVAVGIGVGVWRGRKREGMINKVNR